MLQPNKTKVRSPIKAIGLSPSQQAEAEADALFVNNWNANRVVGGKKLPKGYQISPNQVVQSSELSSVGESGRYDPSTRRVSLDANNTEQGVPAHEYAHIFQDRTKLQRPKTYQDYIETPITNVIPNLGDYDTNPNEIHSELMRFRRNNNYRPDQVITDEDINKVENTNYNFNNISQDNLIKLLNSTADTSVPTTTFAAYGGNINPSNMNYSKRLPKNKRHIAPSALVGTAGGVASMVPGIGTAVGAGLGIVSSVMAQDEASNEERKRQELLYGQQRAQDAIALQNYNQVGNAGVQYYAGGGKLLPSSIKGKYLATGGDLTSLNSTTEVAEGNTHGEKTIDGQYGITLSDGQQPIAEVEDQEVIVNNNQVYSDRLMYDSKRSYADVAKKIAKKAGKIETKLNDTTDSKSRNGYERQLAGTKMAEEALFKHQEQTKYNEGMQEIENLPTTVVMADGGILGEGTMTNSQFAKRIGRFTPRGPEEDPSFAEQLVPGLIDNVGNLLISGNAPEIPLPIYNKVPNLETSVNINPQLSAINDSVNTTSDMLLANTNNSNVARANIAANRLGGLKAKLGLLGERENTERDLRNENVLRQANVAASNNAMTDNYNMNNFTRTGDLQGRLSANLGNLSEDIDKVYARRDQKDYYDTVQLADILDDPTGEKIRTAERNPELYKSAKTRAAIRKEAERKALITPYNYNNIIQSAI